MYAVAGPLLAEAYSDARLNLDSLDKDIAKARAAVKKAAEQIENDLRFALEVTDTEARAQLAAFARYAAQVKKGIEADAVKVQVDAETDAAEAAAVGAQAAAAVESGFGSGVLDARVEVDVADATEAGAAARAAVRAGFGAGALTVGVQIDEGEIVTAALAARAAIAAAVDDVSIGVDLDDFAAGVELAKEAFDFDDAVVKVRLDDQVFNEQLLLTSRLQALTFEAWNVKISTNAFAVLEDIAEIAAALKALTEANYDIGLDVDAEGARRAAQLARERAQLGLDDIEVGVDLKREALLGDIALIQADLDRIARQTLTVTADDDNVRDTLSNLADWLNDLTDEVAVVRVASEDIPETAALLEALDAQLGALDGQVARLSTRLAGGAEVAAELAVLETTVDRIDGRDIDIRADLSALSASLSEAQRFVLFQNERLGRLATQARVAGSRAQRSQLITDAVREETDVVEARALVATRGARRAAAEFQRARRIARSALATEKQVQEAFDKAQAAIDARRAARAARAEAREAAAFARRVARENARIQSLARTRDRDVRIQLRIEGVARVIAGARAVDAALDGIEERRTIRLGDSTGGLLRAILNDLVPVRAGLARFRTEAVATARRVRDAFSRRSGEGTFGFDGSDILRFFRTLPILAVTAATRTRAAFTNAYDTIRNLRADDVLTFLRTLPVLAATAAQRVRNAFRNTTRGQGGFLNLGEIAQQLRDLGRRAVIRIRTDGVRRTLADFAKIVLAKVAVARDIDINVDVDRRGRVTSFFANLRRVVGTTFATLAGPATRGVSRFASFALDSLSTVASSIGGVFQSVASGISNSLSTAREALNGFQQQFADVLQGLGKVAGPAFTAALVATLVVGILGVIPLIVGPLLAGIGALVGAAVAFLAASAISVIGAAVLPAVAVFLNQDAKDKIGALVGELGETLQDEFESVTLFITDVIAPRFAAAFNDLIPVAARAADDFIIPIANSLLGTVGLLEESITNLAGPIGEGIASVLDTLNRFIPTFDDISLAIGPPITDTLNALLEAVFILADVFKGDIASGFQIIADLLREITPGLASFSGFLTPTLQLLGAIIAGIVEAGQRIADQFGDQLAEDFRTIASNAEIWIAAMTGGAQIIVTIISIFARLTEAASDFYEGFQRFFGNALGFVGRAFAAIVRVIGGAIATIIELFGDGIRSVVDTAAAIPGAERLFGGQFDAARDALDALDGVAQNVRGTANDLGDSFNFAGSGMQVALNVSADLASQLRNETRKAMEEGRLSAQSLELEIGALTDRMADGLITTEDYNSQLGELVASSREVSDAFPTASSALRDFIKGTEDGTRRASEFLDDFRRELPTAADFVTTAGQDPAAAIEQQTINILDAIRQRGEQVKQAQENAQRLLAIDAAGFDPLADFLADLDPATLTQALDQLGATGSEAMRNANAAIEEQTRQGTVSIQELLEARGDAIRIEGEKVARLTALEAAGLTDLAKELAGLDPATFKATIEQLFAGGLDAVAAANEQARLLTIAEAENAAAEAERQAQLAQESAVSNASETATRIREEFVGAISGKGLGELLTSTEIGDAGADPAVLAQAQGALAGAGFAETFRDEITGEGGLRSTLTNELAAFQDEIDGFDTAGEQGGNAFVGAAAIALTNGITVLRSIATTVGFAVSLAFVTGAQTYLSSLTGPVVGSVFAAFIAAVPIAVRSGNLTGLAYARTVISTVLNLARAVRDAAARVGQLLATAAPAYLSSGRTAGSQFGLGVIAGILSLAAAVTAIARSVGAQTATAYAQGFLAAFAAAQGTIRVTVAGVFRGVGAGVGEEGARVGADFARGMEAGLRNGLDRLRNTALVLARAIADAVRAALQIRSPSKVAETIGGQFVDGITLGIARATPEALRAAQQLAAGLPQQVGATAAAANAAGQAAPVTRVDRRVYQTNNWNVNGAGDPLAYARRQQRLLERRP